MAAGANRTFRCSDLFTESQEVPKKEPMKPGQFVTITTRRSPGLDYNKPGRPCARSGHAAVADSKNLYIFGGYNPHLPTLRDYFCREEEMLFPLFHEVWRYNFVSNMWKRLQTKGQMPMQLASMSMALYGKYILVYGGTGYPFGPMTSNVVWYLDTKTLQWNAVKPKQEEDTNAVAQPTPGYGQAVSIIDNMLYVYGGTTGWDYNSDVHRCHLATGQWDRLFCLEEQYTLDFLKERPELDPNVPRPRYRHEILTDNDWLYIIGGGTSRDAYPLDKVHAFHLETRKWQLKDTIPDKVHGFPEKRRCHGCAQLNNEGYISGGYSVGKIYDDIWRLELDTLQWTKMNARLPRPVYFHSSAVTPEGCLYCHGGVVSPTGMERSDTLVRIWLKVPSLLMHCWNAILAMTPQLYILPERYLRQLGIPKRLLEKT